MTETHVTHGKSLGAFLSCTSPNLSLLVLGESKPRLFMCRDAALSKPTYILPPFAIRLTAFKSFRFFYLIST